MTLYEKVRQDIHAAVSSACGRLTSQSVALLYAIQYNVRTNLGANDQK